MNLTKRTELRRIPDRGSRDWETINQILDAGFFASIGFCVDGQPFVIPTLYGREREKLYLHGSAASRMLRQLEAGVPACVTVTLVDGLVLSRSAFDHSMNYRSVVAFGNARKVVDPEEKIKSLRVISEHLIAGRWAEVRGPSDNDLKATTVLEFSIEEASSKVRSGPPLDDESDYGLAVWAGVLPLVVRSGPPIPDDKLLEGSLFRNMSGATTLGSMAREDPCNVATMKSADARTSVEKRHSGEARRNVRSFCF